MALFTDQVRQLIAEAGAGHPKEAADEPEAPEQVVEVIAEEAAEKDAEGSPAESEDGDGEESEKKAFADMTDVEKTAAMKTAALEDLSGRVAALAYIDEMQKLADSPVAKILKVLRGAAGKLDSGVQDLGGTIGHGIAKRTGKAPGVNISSRSGGSVMSPNAARGYGYGAGGAGAAGLGSLLGGDKEASADDFHDAATYGAFLGVRTYQTDRG